MRNPCQADPRANVVRKTTSNSSLKKQTNKEKMPNQPKFD